MATPPFKYQPMFEHGEDKTEYYLLTKDYVSVSEFEGTPVLKVQKEGLTAMANTAFRDVSFMLRRAHNEQVAKILSDPEASENDTVRKDSRYGQAIAMKKLCHWVFTRHIRKKTCVIHRMLRSTCTTR